MQAVAEWGGADILVNNAGIQHTAWLAEMPGATWEAILAINLSAAFYTMQAAMPGMAARGYGRVINIASVARAGRLEAKGTLCGGQARVGRPEQSCCSGVCQPWGPGAGWRNRQLHLSGLDQHSDNRAPNRGADGRF